MLKVGGPDPFLVDLEPHSYHDTSLTRTLWFRQVALDYRHDLPVLTVLILLCKEANSPGLTGTYERQLPDGWLTNRYNYRVVRLWQEDPEPYLTAGVGLVPLAPLTDVTEADLPGVVRRMAGRINGEPRPRAAKLWTATYLLMGVRYPDDLVNQLLEGIQTMRESTTYQAIFGKAASRASNSFCFVRGPSASVSPTLRRSPPSRPSRTSIGSKPSANESSTRASATGMTCCARPWPRWCIGICRRRSRPL